MPVAEIHSNGGIKPRTPDVITGGVFVVYGAYVKTVVNRGTVTTYGVNDMVLVRGDSMSIREAYSMQNLSEL